MGTRACSTTCARRMQARSPPGGATLPALGLTFLEAPLEALSPLLQSLWRPRGARAEGDADRGRARARRVGVAARWRLAAAGRGRGALAPCLAASRLPLAAMRVGGTASAHRALPSLPVPFVSAEGEEGGAAGRVVGGVRVGDWKGRQGSRVAGQPRPRGRTPAFDARGRPRPRRALGARLWQWKSSTDGRAQVSGWHADELNVFDAASSHLRGGRWALATPACLVQIQHGRRTSALFTTAFQFARAPLHRTPPPLPTCPHTHQYIVGTKLTLRRRHGRG